MPSRPAITVLLLTRQKVHRADFASVTGVPTVTERERPDAPDVASLVETVLVDGALSGKRTFILASDFWLQTASLPASRAVGMTDADLAAGLNFEAEVLSGLPALESAAAITSLPPAGGERRFLLLQIPTSVRDGIQRVLEERGSKLAGLAHPAALPRSLGKKDLTLQRLELWPDIAVGLRPSGEGFDAQVSNADPSTARWQEDLGDWASEQVLVGPGVEPPDDMPVVSLAGARLEEWFTGWVQELTSRRPRVALVQAMVKPSPPIARLAFAGVLAAAAVGLVYLHFTTTLKKPLADATARIEKGRAATKRLADLQTRETEQTKRAEESAQEAAKYDLLAQQVESHQYRFARLLVALAAQKPADVMIRAIESQGGEPRVLGTALRPEMADDFARGLAPLMRELGWDVQAPKKTAMKLTTDGGPWKFEIDFLRLPESPTPSEPKKRTPPKIVPRKLLPPEIVFHENRP